jgi:hypothetical protein
MSAELGMPDAEVLEGAIVPPRRITLKLNVDTSAFAAAMGVLSERMRVALAPFREIFHRLGHGRPAKCRICNPLGNPPPAPWAADYRRKTRRRNRR